MTDWLIIRSDYQKEAYVVAAIERMGFQAWTPVQIVLSRGPSRCKTSAKAMVKTKDLAVIPKTLFAAIPAGLGGEVMRIRYVTAIEREIDSTPVVIPGNQITRFMDAVNELNDETMLAVRLAETKKTKAKWRNLKDALLDVMKQGAQQQEMAA